MAERLPAKLPFFPERGNFHPLNDYSTIANGIGILGFCRHFQMSGEEKTTVFSVAELSF